MNDTITLDPGGGGGGNAGSTACPGSINFEDGKADSSTIVAVGTKGYLRVPFACTITGWTILADTSTTAVLDHAEDCRGDGAAIIEHHHIGQAHADGG